MGLASSSGRAQGFGLMCIKAPESLFGRDAIVAWPAAYCQCERIRLLNGMCCVDGEKNQKELYKARALVYNGQVIKNDPLAQLEERHLDVVEVTGSSPVGITI